MFVYNNISIEKSYFCFTFSVGLSFFILYQLTFHLFTKLIFDVYFLVGYKFIGYQIIIYEYLLHVNNYIKLLLFLYYNIYILRTVYESNTFYKYDKLYDYYFDMVTCLIFIEHG